MYSTSFFSPAVQHEHRRVRRLKVHTVDSSGGSYNYVIDIRERDDNLDLVGLSALNGRPPVYIH